MSTPVALISNELRLWLADEIDKSVSASETIDQCRGRLRTRITENAEFWKHMKELAEAQGTRKA